jgi:hypothetical protein
MRAGLEHAGQSQCTKSLRDRPLRGGENREPVASREDSEGGWQAHRDQQADGWDGRVQLKINRIKMTCGPVPNAVRETLPDCWNDKIGLDEQPQSVC